MPKFRELSKFFVLICIKCLYLHPKILLIINVLQFMKRILMTFFCVLCVSAYTFAQTVSGKVTSSEDGAPLPGVSVVVKGTTSGTVTDPSGAYSLIVDGEGAVLVFSFVGYATQEVAVSGRSSIDVSLSSDSKALEEVVVTALGITREKASLGYSVSSVATDQIEGRQETDVARLLRGKATGVDITSTSGLAGSGTNVIIRGYSSISGSNQPLYVSLWVLHCSLRENHCNL